MALPKAIFYSVNEWSCSQVTLPEIFPKDLEELKPAEKIWADLDDFLRKGVKATFGKNIKPPRNTRRE